MRSIAVATAVSIAILAAFIWLAFLSRPEKQALESTSNAIAYSRIECNSPPGRTRKEFLDEIRYLGLPESIPANAEGERILRESFLRHIAVEKILSLSIQPSQGRIALELQFRETK